MIVCSGRLRGASTFGMRAIQREQRAPVLKRETGAFGHDAGSEAREVALDQRHHVAVAIDHGQVRRVAGVNGKRGGRRPQPERSRGVDRLRPGLARSPCSTSRSPERWRTWDRQHSAACRRTRPSSPRSWRAAPRPSSIRTRASAAPRGCSASSARRCRRRSAGARRHPSLDSSSKSARPIRPQNSDRSPAAMTPPRRSMPAISRRATSPR